MAAAAERPLYPVNADEDFRRWEHETKGTRSAPYVWIADIKRRLGCYHYRQGCRGANHQSELNAKHVLGRPPCRKCFTVRPFAVDIDPTIRTAQVLSAAEAKEFGPIAERVQEVLRRQNEEQAAYVKHDDDGVLKICVLSAEERRDVVLRQAKTRAPLPSAEPSERIRHVIGLLGSSTQKESELTEMLMRLDADLDRFHDENMVEGLFYLMCQNRGWDLAYVRFVELTKHRKDVNLCEWLCMACVRGAIPLAKAIMHFIPGDIDQHENERTALVILCSYLESNARTLGVFDEVASRSSDASLTAALFQVINNFDCHTASESFKHIVIEVVEMLLCYARDDGSGVDLLTPRQSDSMTAHEYALSRIDESQLELRCMFKCETCVQCITARMRYGRFAVCNTMIFTATQRVKAWRARFPDVLFGALSAFIPVRQLVSLIGSFTIPRFDDLVKD